MIGYWRVACKIIRHSMTTKSQYALIYSTCLWESKEYVEFGDLFSFMIEKKQITEICFKNIWNSESKEIYDL